MYEFHFHCLWYTQNIPTYLRIPMIYFTNTWFTHTNNNTNFGIYNDSTEKTVWVTNIQSFSSNTWYIIDYVFQNHCLYLYINNSLAVSFGNNSLVVSGIYLTGLGGNAANIYYDDIFISNTTSTYKIISNYNANSEYYLQRELTPYESFTDKENNIYGNI